MRRIPTVLFCACLFGQVGQAAETSAFTLPNGLRVRLAAGSGDKKAVVILAVRAGFLEEPKGQAHLAHVTEHLTVFDLTPGSAESKHVARWYAAGKANGETLSDFMYFDLHVGADEIPAALAVQAARLASPRFARETLAREVPRTLSEVAYLEKAKMGGPGKFAVSAFVQAAFHGRDSVPLKAETQTITVDQVKDFHARLFRPDRAILAVVGDMDLPAVRKEIEAVFSRINKPEKPFAPRRNLAKSGMRTVAWDVATPHVLIGWPCPSPGNRDHAALALAGLLLMQRFHSDATLMRLAKYTFVENDLEGLFLLNSQAKSTADSAALQERLLHDVAEFAGANGVRDFEVQALQKQLAHIFGPIKLDGSLLPAHVTRSMALANLTLHRLRHEIVWGDLGARVQDMQAVDAAAVRQAVAQYLQPKAAVVVRLEPMDKGGAP